MGGLGDALEPTSNFDGPRKKTAEEFLGANANLVNLDNLVSKPTGTGNTASGNLGLGLLDDFSQSGGRQDTVGQYGWSLIITLILSNVFHLHLSGLLKCLFGSFVTYL